MAGLQYLWKGKELASCLAMSNLVCRAASRLWEQVDFPVEGFKVHLINNIPLPGGWAQRSRYCGSLVAANLLSGGDFLQMKYWLWPLNLRGIQITQHLLCLEALWFL